MWVAPGFLRRARADFERKGYVAVPALLKPHELEQAQDETEAIVRKDLEGAAGGARKSAMFSRDTFFHVLPEQIPASYALRRKMLDNPNFLEFLRRLTGIDDLEFMPEKPRGSGYESNYFTGKINVYDAGMGSFHPHFDKKSFDGEQLAIVFTLSSEGGAPMRLRVKPKSPRAGRLDLEEIPLEANTLTIHDSGTVFHEVLKPDANTRRVAFLMQAVRRGARKHQGSAEKARDYLEASRKTLYTEAVLGTSKRPFVVLVVVISAAITLVAVAVAALSNRRRRLGRWAKGEEIESARAER